MTRKIKFGIVGIGHIGVRHAQCIIDNSAAELISSFDVSKDQSHVIGSVQQASSFKELIQKDIDVVSICTPNYLHADMAIDALRANKHVIIEKPMTISTKDAQNIIDTARDFNKLVFCLL